MIGLVIGFFGFPIAFGIARGLARIFGLYDIVEERRCHVYVLFGEVVGVIKEPGFHFLLRKLGWRAPLVRLFGQRSIVDMRLNQTYLRSQAVNSEEGAPMGIGIWYESAVDDAVKFLFENADPNGSLMANVNSATVRSLSNLKLASMLESRHHMSRTVRTEVAEKASDWGYRLGSVYIRKVHFRDAGMIRQIEEKVVNRLRQVTSAIQQEGSNQVNVITSTAERQAAVAFARASALRAEIVGEALNTIAADKDVAEAMFEILEVQRALEGQGRIVLLPKGAKFLLGDA